VSTDAAPPDATLDADIPPASGLLPSAPLTGPVRGGESAFDAPLVSPAIARQLVGDGSVGLTPEQLAEEIARTYDLDTPDGWTEAMRSLAGRREVLRRLARDLTLEHSHPKLFHAALKYVTENGVGRPIERHEHLHRGAIAHVHVTPPIQWTDGPVTDAHAAPTPPAHEAR
jgi:hypothetical protein